MEIDEFVCIMEKMVKSNGKVYAENTVSSYANALFWDTLRGGSKKERLWMLCCERLKINTALCYGRLTKAELEKIFSFMRENGDAVQLDKSFANKTTSNAVKMLIRCL